MCCKLSDILSSTLFSYNNATANLQHCVIVLLYCNAVAFSGEPFYERQGWLFLVEVNLYGIKIEAVIAQIFKIIPENIH